MDATKFDPFVQARKEFEAKRAEKEQKLLEVGRSMSFKESCNRGRNRRFACR